MKSNNVKIYIFIFIIFLFIFGGFYLMKKSEKLKNSLDKKVTEVKNTDIRIDKTKEYVYFTNVNVLEGELDIEYKDININFESNEDIQTILNKENEEMSKTAVYDETNEEANYNHLISAKFAKYEIVYFANYISIVESKYSFDYKTIISTLGSETYVFDKKTGKLYSKDELLALFNLSKDDVKNKVKTYFNDKNLVTEENKVDTTITIDNMTNYNLYVDNLGRLVISVLAKADKNDYNEVIVLS